MKPTIKELKEGLNDIIFFDFDVLRKIESVFAELNNSLQEYSTTTCDLETLERLKVNVAANLVYFSYLFGEIRKFKGTNHIYLTDARKRLKARVMKSMSGSISSKSELVYDEPDFVAGIRLIEYLRSQFIVIEELYNSYERLFNSITQTISKEGKQFQSGQ